MPETFEQLLDRPSSAFGIDPGFWDIWGHHHTTTTEAKQAILRGLGFAADNLEELERSLAALTRREWERLLPATVVARESAETELVFNVPAELLGQRAQIAIRREDGSTAEFERNLWELPQTAHIEMDGRTWVRTQARLPICLPLGYHDISVKLGGTSAVTRYIVTPDRAWTAPDLGRGGRAAGVAVSLYGVRSTRNWGCGDFGDLLDVVDWVAEDLDASFVALNPLHAIHNRRPFNTSPYLPNSSFYQNFLYLDVESMADYAGNRRAQRLRQSPELLAEIEALRGAPLVEYERVSALKLRFLKLLFAGFLREWRPGPD